MRKTFNPFRPRHAIALSPYLDAAAAAEIAWEAERVAMVDLDAIGERLEAELWRDRSGTNADCHRAADGIGEVLEILHAACRKSDGLRADAAAKHRSLYAALRFKAMPEEVAEVAREIINEADLDEVAPEALAGKEVTRWGPCCREYSFQFGDDGRTIYLTGIISGIAF